jgi:hypothetical protein
MPEVRPASRNAHGRYQMTPGVPASWFRAAVLDVVACPDELR